VVLGVALVVGVIALGVGVYQAGYAAGLATDGGTVIPPVAYGYGWGWHGGFGIFGFLGFLLFLFLLFSLFRAMAWGGRGWRGPGGYRPGGPWNGPGAGADADAARWGGARREAFEAWHRQAHESDAHAAGAGDPSQARPT
jgi:hypothetical protein